MMHDSWMGMHFLGHWGTWLVIIVIIAFFVFFLKNRGGK